MEATSNICCCVIGDVFVDVQANGVDRLPTWNSDTGATSIEVLPGGSAANTARQLHALVTSDVDGVARHIDVKFISTLGNDYFGKLFKDICDKEQLRCHLEELQCPTSVCMCLSGPLDRAFVSCYSSTDAFEYRHMESEIPTNVAHLHIGGYFNLIGLHTNEFVNGCRALKSKGVTLSISTQYDAREKWTGENDILRHVFPLCDIVFLNESELEKVLPVLQGHDVIVVETRGAKGCRVYQRGVPKTDNQQATGGNVVPIDVPLESRVGNIVDATGAGDAFIAGFLDKWMDKLVVKTKKRTQHVDCAQALADGARLADDGNLSVELTECCRRGHRVAGLNVQRQGACRQPISVNEIDENLS